MTRHIHEEATRYARTGTAGIAGASMFVACTVARAVMPTAGRARAVGAGGPV